jgi:transposase
MEQRERFVHAHREGYYSMVKLCARYGVSCKIGYKWLAGFDDGGHQALRDRSRAPRH